MCQRGVQTSSCSQSSGASAPFLEAQECTLLLSVKLDWILKTELFKCLVSVTYFHG